MSSVRLFVYGSLKRGFRHEDELRGATFVGDASTGPGFRLVRYGQYPALARRAEESSAVSGELYQVPLASLPALDEFEDCPDLYQREEIALSDGTRAFAYLIAAEHAAGLQEIPGGVWSSALDAQRADMGL